MAIKTSYYQHDGYAIDASDVSFGESESKEILINRQGTINKVKIRKESVTFKIKGATNSDLSKYESQRNAAVVGLLSGAVSKRDLNIGGKRIEQAVLTDVKVSAPFEVNGITIFESIDLEYQSQVYT